MVELEYEVLRVIHLDRDNTVIADRIDWTGGTMSVQVRPRDIVRDAMAYGARGILLAHNHPSASAHPSEPDLEATREIAAACARAGISVIDHMIVARSGAFSMRAAGLCEDWS